jgi:hypothetical protein
VALEIACSTILMTGFRARKSLESAGGLSEHQPEFLSGKLLSFGGRVTSNRSQ